MRERKGKSLARRIALVIKNAKPLAVKGISEDGSPIPRYQEVIELLRPLLVRADLDYTVSLETGSISQDRSGPNVTTTIRVQIVLFSVDSDEKERVYVAGGSLGTHGEDVSASATNAEKWWLLHRFRLLVVPKLDATVLNRTEPERKPAVCSLGTITDAIAQAEPDKKERVFELNRPWLEANATPTMIVALAEQAGIK